MTPPPIAHVTVTLTTANVNYVDWQPNSSNLLALLADNSLSFFGNERIELRSLPLFKFNLRYVFVDI